MPSQSPTSRQVLRTVRLHVILVHNTLTLMPDVGLFTATQPVDAETKIIIKYAVEVGGLPVYQESYDVRSLAKELEKDPAKAETLWLRRLEGPVRCMDMPKFSSNVTQWIAEGHALNQDTDLKV